MGDFSFRAVDVLRTVDGVLARSGVDRKDAIAELAELRHTAILYESPNRVAATLADIAESGGADRLVVVAREMTKQFEEIRRGTVAELAAYYDAHVPRGE